MTRRPGVAPFLVAAERYAARCLEIDEIGRAVSVVPTCRRIPEELSVSLPFPDPCYRAVSRSMSQPDPRQESMLWWEATDDEIAAMCPHCRVRVALWRQRYKLRRTLGGLKRALLASYRAERAKKGAAA